MDAWQLPSKVPAVQLVEDRRCLRSRTLLREREVGSIQEGCFFFWFRPWQTGKALLPDGTGESPRNQESEQSNATIVPQVRVVADMTRRQGEINLKPEDAAGTTMPVHIPRCSWGK